MSSIDRRSDGYYMNPLSPLDRAGAEIERARIDRYLRFRVIEKIQVPHHIYSLAMVPIVVSGVFAALIISGEAVLVGSIAITVCLLTTVGVLMIGRRIVKRKKARRTELDRQTESYVRIPDALIDMIRLYTRTYPYTDIWGDMPSALEDIASWRSRQFWRIVDIYNEVEVEQDSENAVLLINSAKSEFDDMWRYIFRRQMAL